LRIHGSHRPARPSRWAVALLVAVGLLVSGCSASGPAKSGAVGASSGSGSTGRVVAAAGELGGAFTASSVASTETVLAADGVATVANEASTAPLLPVSGPIRMRFTQAQVRAMALQAADGGGITGSALDAAVALPANSPSFSYLLAAWISKSTTPAATAIRALMGRQDWSQAPEVVFPAIVLPLFVADVIAASPAPSGSTTSTSAFSQHANSRTAVESAGFVQSGLLSTPCSTASNFIQTVLNSVFSALQLSAPSGTGLGSAVGGFFVGIWNGALTLAQQAVSTLISALTGPVLAAIKAAAAGAAVISQIAAYLNPWSVKVTADPGTLDPGGQGSFTATVDAGLGGADYPSAVTDCAGALGITLPPLTTADAPATWDPTGPLSTADATSVTLDAQGTSTLSVTATQPTTDSDTCTDSGDDSASTGVGRITVTRPGLSSLKQLATTMLTNGLGAAGSVVGPIVQSILSPMLDTVLGQLDGLTQTIGAGTLTVNAPAPTDACTPTPTSTPTTTAAAQSAACIIGTWTTTDWTNTYLPDERGLAGAKWTLTPDGAWTEQFDGSSPLLNVGGSLTVTYTGTATGTVQLSSDSATARTGPWKASNIQGTVTGTFSDGSVKAYPYAEWGWAPETGTWTCSGNSMSVTYAESTGSTATVSLTRTTN